MVSIKHYMKHLEDTKKYMKYLQLLMTTQINLRREGNIVENNENSKSLWETEGDQILRCL